MIGNNKMIVDGFDTSDTFIIRKVNRGFTGMYSNKTDLMRLTQRKITERTINVEVTLISTYGLNELKTILNKSSTVRFVFSDDKDWYWDGILDTSKINSSYLGADISLEILVPDGIKHAINPKGPYSATQGSDGRYSVTVTNEGNVDIPITMTATMNAENGYIGMYTDYGITEIGNKEEDDTEDYVSATTILNTSNFSEFTRYTGTNPENSAKGNDGYATIRTEGSTNYFHLSNAGTNNNYWHGASYVYDFPADGTGHVGAKNVYCYFNAVFWAGMMGQTGQIQVLFTDANNHLVMGYDIYKNDTKGNSGVWAALAGDGNGGKKILKINTFQTSHLDKDNPFNKPRGHADIYKNGAKLRYYWFGSYPEFTVPELKDVEITKCYINFYQLANRTGNQLMSYFDLRRMMIRNDSAESIRDIKNRYQPETTVKMTGADSKVYVNGLPKLTEKVDGSNLFTIPPGETTIYFQCSDWCTTPPTYQIEFTEANL
ncbi:MAG: phage tail family protein [Lactococcus chungangensis]|nr:phage tail family protein [Lactococcus chungangensis]